MRERVAVVAGAAGDIGRAVSESLATNGFRVAALDLQEPVSAGHHVGFWECDVSDHRAVRRCIASIAHEHGDIDTLVNAAAIVPDPTSVPENYAEYGLEDWERIMSVNLDGSFFLAREVFPLMRRLGFGRIVFIGSMGGRMRSAFSGPAYGAAKAGLAGLSRSLAGNFGPHGITVNIVSPGRIRSRAAHAFPLDPEKLAAIPAGREGEPREVAAAVLFCCAEAASYVNGTIIDVTGGAFMP